MKKLRMTAVLAGVLCLAGAGGIVNRSSATRAHSENGRREIGRAEALQPKLRYLPRSPC